VTLPAHPYAHPKTTILPSLKMSKISSVTVFTEVVAMISSFHRNSEKEKKIQSKEKSRELTIAQNEITKK
jgi:hypothetical protein